MLKNIIKSGLTFSIAAIPMFMSNSLNISPAKAAALACYDNDGNDIYTSGSLTTTTQYDATGNLLSIGETVNDKCLTLDAAGGWVEGSTGTHIEEATCTDNVSGSITLTVHECLGGCNNGACAIVSDPTVNTVVSTTSHITKAPTQTTVKVEDKGTITSLFDGGVVINTIKVFVGPTSTIKYNDYLKALASGQKAEYKGFKNDDGSITVTKIEVRNAK